MLALKTLGSADHAGKTLIFDEVDAGIGGRVASVVGDKLSALGSKFQVLCITHLPQIAAAAATHYYIDKQVRGDRTVTSVSRLTPDERVDEVARMMGGVAAGAQARASARELLDAQRPRAKAKVEPRAKAKVGSQPPEKAAPAPRKTPKPKATSA
jgi:DNA repair protein RecN (Recombination protein N)